MTEAAMTLMTLTVRPFTRFIELPDRPVVHEVVGRIVGQSFVFSALGTDYELQTIQVSRDAHGQFALVSPMEIEAKPNWFLRVEPQSEEDNPDYCGCQISLIHSPELANLGWNPTNHNYICPPRVSLSVNFGTRGFVDGGGGGGHVVRAERPRA